jgi:hypothetical protein
MSYVAAELNASNATGTPICQLENVLIVTSGVFLVVMNGLVDKRMVIVIMVVNKDDMVSHVDVAAVVLVKMSVTGKLVYNLLICNRKYNVVHV